MHFDAVTADGSTPILASPRRRLLAVYIDYLLFGAFWTVVESFVRLPFPDVIRWISFGVLDLILQASLASPGLRFLGIHKEEAIGADTRPRLLGAPAGHA